MSGAVREKDSADYDLERFIEIFDEALTSNDTRVKNALRQLMMMVILTSNEHEDRGQVRSHREGPLRRMQEDLRDVATRMHMVDDKIRRLENDLSRVLNQNPNYSGGYNISQMYPQVHSNGTVPGNSISAAEYWKNQAQVKYDAQISEDLLRGLNIKVNGGLTPKEK